MRLITTLSLFFVVAMAHANPIDELNFKIQESGAQWEAGDTHMTLDEMRSMLDPSLYPHPEVRFESPDSIQAFALPSSLDWRKKDGKNWMSAIRHQQSCGSCLAFAAVSAVESQYRIVRGQSSASIKLSPQYLFSCGGGVCKKGWYPDQAAKFLMKTGVPDDSCMPYSSGGGSDVACTRACKDSAKRAVKISSYTRPTVNALKISALKEALQRGPLVTTMGVYADFMNYRRGIYKRVSNRLTGGHAITLIGYNDSERYFIIRNSWGTTWGESGYGRISYDDTSGIGASTWKYEMAKPKAFDLPLLNAALESLEESTNRPQREIASVAQEASLELSPSFQLRSNSADVELVLENQQGEYNGAVNFHMVHKGLEKIVETQMSGTTLKVYLNTALLAEGEWDFYASTVNSAGETVKTSAVSLNVAH